MHTAKRHRRHVPFYAAVLSGLLALPLAYWLRPDLVVQAAANIAFLVYLGLSGRLLPRLTATFLRKNAADADEPVWAIFAVTMATITLAVAALFSVINSGDQPDAWTLGLSLASVVLGWLTIHTMFGLHYAHRHWEPVPERERNADKQDGGLEFPGTEEPEGYDFIYFAFVIGMTAQTSDVQIKRTNMRKLAWLHGMVSFLFNTVLVAAAVNVAVSLAS